MSFYLQEGKLRKVKIILRGYLIGITHLRVHPDGLIILLHDFIVYFKLIIFDIKPNVNQ